MSDTSTRRQFLARVGTVAAGAALGGAAVPGCRAQPNDPQKIRKPRRARVVIARDERLTGGEAESHRDLLSKLLDAAMQRLTDAPDAAAAWTRSLKS